MKKVTLKMGFVSLLFLAPFFVSAATSVYFSTFQGGQIQADAQTVIGNFAVSQNYVISTGGISAIFFNASSTPITFTGSPQIVVATTTPTSNAHAIGVFTTCNGQTIQPGATLACTGVINGANGNTHWLPGFTYYVMNDDAQTSDPGLVYIGDNTQTLFYGFINSGDGTDPGWIPGLSQVGVASSTLRQFCNDSFATTTGFWDSLTSGFSNALCNVTTFLFVPSQNSLNNLQTQLESLSAKAPISWAVEVRDVYAGYIATSTDEFPALSLELGTSTGGILPSSIELLSEDKVEQFAGSTALTLFKALLATVFWLGALSFIYRQISSVWHKQVT